MVLFELQERFGYGWDTSELRENKAPLSYMTEKNGVEKRMLPRQEADMIPAGNPQLQASSTSNIFPIGWKMSPSLILDSPHVQRSTSSALRSRLGGFLLKNKS
jgi:hypothetical protein